MTLKNIPLELLCLIFDFSYNCSCLKNPMEDVEVQKNIQRSVPPCFLMSRLPKKGWTERNGSEYVRNFECILIPNPFQRGNPYFPTCQLDPGFPKWSPTLETFAGLLTSSACRRNHTYKACVLRKVRMMRHASVLRWNDFFQSLFSKDYLLDPENFFMYAYPWSRSFISEVTSQLRTAQFLPFYSHMLV